MTDSDAALRFDAMLDGNAAATPATEPLFATATRLRELDLHQRALPSEAFREQLRRSLHGSPNGTHTLSDADRPIPLPPSRPAIRRVNQPKHSYRLLAVAAALLLLVGGAGAIVRFPMGQQRDSEPSAIPAVSLASPASSVESAPPSPASAVDGIDWIANGPEGSEYQSPEGWAYGDGRIFRTIGAGTGWPHIQAVDTEDGSILWDLPSPVAGYLNAKDGLLLVAGQDGQSLRIEFVLVALNAQTGDEVWRTSISQLPVGMKVVGDRAYILGADNNLEAIDLNTHTHLYVRSIGGDSKPRSTIEGQATSPTLRMAIVDDTLVAVLADGSLVGVELGTGAVTWWSLTDVPHRIWLHDVGGHLVAVDGGSWKDISGEVYSSATPRPEPSSCLETVVQNDTSADYAVRREALHGIDPATGEQTWAATSTLWSSQLLDSGQGLVFMVNTPPADIPATRSQVLVCQIDPPTGDVRQIEDLSSLTSATFRFASTDDEGDELAVGVLSDGRYIALPADLVPEWAGLSVALHMSTSHPGIAWTAVIDGQIYFSLQDGRLVKVHSNQPIPTPADSVEPPQYATPNASGAGWIAHAPDGIGDEFAEAGNAHLIANGRVFRAFTMDIGSPHIQAIDADTGEILWDVKIKSGGGFMAAAGDLLLVPEISYTLPGHIVALDVATGREVWTAPLSDDPVAMLVTADRALVLGSSDKLDVIDLQTGEPVYTVDIHGDAQKVIPSTFRDLTAQRHRMAVDGETLYVTLADGSVVAVDLETGVAKWWSLRSVPGQVDAYVIDGAVVVVDAGDQTAIEAQFQAERQAAMSGTPVATPVFDSALPSCAQPNAVATPASTPQAGAAPGSVYRGLDEDTGEVRWSTAIPEQSFGPISVDAGALYLLIGGDPGKTTLPQYTYCFVDVQTGQSREINPLEKISGRILKFERPSLSVTYVAIVSESGLMLPVPSKYAAHVTEPVAVLGQPVDEMLHGGWFWGEVYGDAIYYSLVNGDLVKIPIPAA